MKSSRILEQGTFEFGNVGFSVKLTELNIVNHHSNYYIKCHYCEQLGHVVQKCPSKRKGIKPCQTYIESGIRHFGPDYKWNTRKTNDAKLAHSVTAQEEEEGKVHAFAAVSEQLQTPSSARCVALIKADYL